MVRKINLEKENTMRNTILQENGQRIVRVGNLIFRLEDLSSIIPLDESQSSSFNSEITLVNDTILRSPLSVDEVWKELSA